MTDPAEIAKELTEAQREAIASSGIVRQSGGVLVLPIYRDGGAMSRSLIDLKLAGYSRYGAALTKDGKAVRAYLKEQSNER